MRNLKSAVILIVEDIPYNQVLLREFLKIGGYKNIITASDAKEAYDVLRSNAVDLILLDIHLADENGVVVCKKLKSNEATKDIPIIIQTSSISAEDKIAAFQYGANDFLLKPLDNIDVLLRVKNQLHQQRLYQQLKISNDRIAFELEAARNMLISLLPSDKFIQELSEKYHTLVAKDFIPSSELGGDFYNVIPLDDDRFLTYYWDFAGHGISSAINTFRLHTIIQQMIALLPFMDPGAILSKLNNDLMKLLDIKHYATMFIGITDIKKQELYYAAAACPNPILINATLSQFQLLNSRNFPLGIKANHVYETITVDLKKWNALVFYSDALIETPNKTGDMLSSEELAEKIMAIKQSAKSNYAEIMTKNFTKAFLKERGQRLVDDYTLSVLYFKEIT